jgi:biofilm protein TabA
MFHAALSDPDTYAGLIGSHPVWRECLEWLRNLKPDVALGNHPLRGDAMFASVQEYSTLPREEARFESHRAHVDLQYTLVGTEVIDWIPRNVLREEGPFANDVQFWQPPSNGFASIPNSAGRFCIFFPGDAHRPKVQEEAPRPVRKLVIKIRLELLS